MFSYQPDNSLQSNYGLLSRSLNSNTSFLNQNQYNTQMLGQTYPLNNTSSQLQASKRVNPYEEELQMMKKVKTQQMMNQPSDWAMSLNSINNNKAGAFMNNISQNPYESQYVQNQVSLELIQPNSLLNLNSNNLLRNLAQPNQRTATQQFFSRQQQPNLALDSLIQSQYNLNQIDLLQQQLHLQQQQQQLQQLQQQQLQQQQQQQQFQLLLNQAAQQNLFLDLSSITQLPNVDDLTIQAYQAPVVVNPALSYALVNGQLVQVNQPNLTLTSQQEYNSYTQQQGSLLLNNVVSDLFRDSENSFNKIPELIVNEAEINSEVKNFNENINEVSETSTKVSEGSRSEDEKEPEEIKPTVKKTRVPRPRSILVFQSKSPEISSPEDSAKNAERRKNRWQQVQEDKEKDYKAERVRLINEVPVDFEAQKIISTPIGGNNQAEIPALCQRPKRALQSVWSPVNANGEALEQFLSEVEQILGVIDQQKCLKVLSEKEGNIEEALNAIKLEKKKYINQFSIKPRNKKFFL